MTLGNAAAARVRLIVWCKDCQHQVEPDPAEIAARYGAETPTGELRRRDRGQRQRWRVTPRLGARCRATEAEQRFRMGKIAASQMRFYVERR